MQNPQIYFLIFVQNPQILPENRKISKLINKNWGKYRSLGGDNLDDYRSLVIFAISKNVQLWMQENF